jgi:sodium transport system ATP-binding protein
MIEAKGLTKIFRDRKRGPIRAVDAVNFRCEPGRIFGLLGVNGAGKTTCLRMLATILAPTSGTASVNGFDIVTAPEKVRASIGFLSTATALYGRLTAFEVDSISDVCTVWPTAHCARVLTNFSRRCP